MNREQLDVLLSLTDSPESTVASNILQRLVTKSENALSLIRSGFLMSAGSNNTVEIGGCFFRAFRDAEQGQAKYFEGLRGWVTVPSNDLKKLYLNYSQFFAWVMRLFAVNQHYRVDQLVDDVFWSLGQFRVGKHKIQLYFARRFDHPDHVRSFLRALKLEPKQPGIILTSFESPVPFDCPRHLTMIPFVQLISRRNDRVTVEVAALESLLAGASWRGNEQGSALFSHSASFRSIEWGGILHNPTVRQAALIEFLFNSGGRVHLTDIQQELGTNEKVHQIMRNKVNGKWQASALWQALIKSDGNGYYYLDIYDRAK